MTRFHWLISLLAILGSVCWCFALIDFLQDKITLAVIEGGVVAIIALILLAMAASQ